MYEEKQKKYHTANIDGGNGGRGTKNIFNLYPQYMTMR